MQPRTGREGAPTKEKPFKRALRPEDTVALHRAHRDWLSEKLRVPFEGPTVVVTHHGPHRGSLASAYAIDWLSGAFVSELPEEFFEVPSLWIQVPENDSFDPALVVEIH